MPTSELLYINNTSGIPVFYMIIAQACSSSHVTQHQQVPAAALTKKIKDF
jgi:hypothetical protein